MRRDQPGDAERFPGGKTRAPAAAILLAAVCLTLAPPEADGGEKAQARAAKRQTPSYRCQGFIAPLRDGMEVARGRTLPLKATLLDAKGSRLNAARVAAPPKVELVFRPGTPAESDVTDEIEAGDFGSGTKFVFRETYWKFDLPTEELSETGPYRVSLVSAEESRYKIEPLCVLRFQLR